MIWKFLRGGAIPGGTSIPESRVYEQKQMNIKNSNLKNKKELMFFSKQLTLVMSIQLPSENLR